MMPLIRDPYHHGNGDTEAPHACTAQAARATDGTGKQHRDARMGELIPGCWYLTYSLGLRTAVVGPHKHGNNPNQHQDINYAL
jgi:hypothetical protein